MYWTPYGTQDLWNKFNIICDPIQCVAIRTAVKFFKKLPKALFLQLSLHISHQISHLMTESGVIKVQLAPKTCENNTYQYLKKHNCSFYCNTLWWWAMPAKLGCNIWSCS
jgi:hypothetical protein